MGGGIFCLRVADGEILWQRSLTEDFGGAVPSWSFRESPLVDGEKVVCTPGGPDATLVALSKTSGETLWKSKLPAVAASEAREDPARETPRRRQSQDRNNQARSDRDRPNRNQNAGNTQARSAQSIAGTRDSNLFTSEHLVH